MTQQVETTCTLVFRVATDIYKQFLNGFFSQLVFKSLITEIRLFFNFDFSNFSIALRFKNSSIGSSSVVHYTPNNSTKSTGGHTQKNHWSFLFSYPTITEKEHNSS